MNVGRIRDIRDRFLLRHYRGIQQEISAFKCAMLSKLRSEGLPAVPSDAGQNSRALEVRRQVSSLSVHSQHALANAEFAGQLNKILRTMHKHLRGLPLVFHPGTLPGAPEADPDEFPLTSTLQLSKKKLCAVVEDFPELRRAIQRDLGFGLELKPSDRRSSNSPSDPLRSERREPLESVFLRVREGTLPAGSLLGFVPGVYRSFRTAYMDLGPNFILRPDGRRFLLGEKIPHPMGLCRSVEEFAYKANREE